MLIYNNPSVPFGINPLVAEVIFFFSDSRSHTHKPQFNIQGLLCKAVNLEYFGSILWVEQLINNKTVDL